jgi:DNA-binding response OmpR family regulator
LEWFRQSTTQEAAGIMNRARILVVDDDPLFRSLITSMLRKEYLVMVAADGSEGYYKALEHLPQVAIIDVQMPGWDGLRTVQAFRAHQALAKVPIMMLTSDASRQTVVAAIQCGANDYVIKTTLSRDELLKKLRRLINIGPVRVNSPGGETGDTAAPGTESGGPAEIPTVAHEEAGSASDVGSEAAALQALMDNWE